MRRLEQLQDESNAERWMVSYADFITLLFGFFVVMYAISSVNDEKYKVLSDTLAQAFDVPALSPDAIQVGEPTLAASPHVVDLPDSTAYADQFDGDTFIEDPIESTQSLLGGFAAQEGVSIHANHDWMELKLDASLLFSPGNADMSERAQLQMTPLMTLLETTKLPVTVEGYTDNIVSESNRFPSNWELSAARASAVARYLVDQGVRAERISAVGYGENHPIATNATPQGRAQNRRVVIVVARRAGASRDLNARPDSSAMAFVRQSNQPSLDGVSQSRTEQGGLLFSNNPPSQDTQRPPPDTQN